MVKDKITMDIHTIIQNTSRFDRVEIPCKCPIHNDKNMSASFNQKKGLLYCFVCGYIPLSDLDLTYQPDKYYKPLREIENVSITYTQLAINNSYLKSRGVSNAMINKYNIREDTNGIIFPITIDGELIATNRRQYERKPRYIYRGIKPDLYPMYHNPDRYLFICEGIFGVLNIEKYGYQAATTFGSKIDKAKIKNILSLYPNSIFVFDNDKAGKRARHKIYCNGGNSLDFLFEADEINMRDVVKQITKGKIKYYEPIY